MNTKNFIIGGIVGGISQYLLGWLFYGILFKNQMPASEHMNFLFIFLGCMTTGFYMSFIFNKWANIATLQTGAMAGGIIGLFSGLISSFFKFAEMPVIDYNYFMLDTFIMIAMQLVTGAVIGFVNSKLKSE